MVDVPDELRCLFSARLEQRDGTYVFEVPRGEVERGNVDPGAVYRVATVGVPTHDGAGDSETATADGAEPPPPPVERGEVRSVTVETTGDEGDGIAKVERGYVLIVQDGRPGEEVTVEVTTVRQNFAIARVVA